MHHLSKFGFSVTGLACILYCVGCVDEASAPQIKGTGGTTHSSGGSGGSGVGGTTAAGGTTETGGTTESGGKPGTGGSSQTAGATGRTGGTSATDAGPGPGGRTGTDGSTGSGGTTADIDAGRDGRRTDGRTSSGGNIGAGGNLGAGGTTTGMGGSTVSTGPLKKWFGNIDTRGSIRSDFASMWDQFSPENAGKWGEVQGSSQSSFNWNSLDKMHDYCTKNNIIFKEHCFIWGSQQPKWVTSSNATDAVKNWMKEFCTRYPDVRVIDVVNEPLHPTPSYKEGLGGAGSSGWDWIVNALKYAKEACPNAVLVVNDYNTIEYSSENGRIISLINAVKKGGGPIDAVGCQSHDIAKVSQSTMTSYGQKIIDQTGLPLHITEMDIGIADDNQQLQKMKDFVTWAWENPKIDGITYWGYIVGATWRSNTGLMTDSGSKRPSLTWLLDYLKR